MKTKLGLMLGILGVLLVLAQPARRAWAEGEGEGKKKERKEGGKGGLPPFTIPTVETVEERLGEKLTDDQKAKITAGRDELKKKYDELAGKDEVKAAMEELKKAREANNEESMKTARDNIKKALGDFNLFGEYKKVLSSVLTPEQVEKALQQPKRDGPKKAGEHGDKKQGGGEKKEGGGEKKE